MTPIAALIDGRTILDLAEGLQLRRVRVMGANRIELTGFTDTMRERLRAYGLFSEIISWKLRFFVPTTQRVPPSSQAARPLSRSSASASGRQRDGASQDASELAQRLGRQAEAVCRHYLSPAARGQYWQVGDVRNTPGRSMFVRLQGTAEGPAGKWTDAATGEHGDLLDVIRKARPHRLRRRRRRGPAFLSLPHPEPQPHPVAAERQRHRDRPRRHGGSRHVAADRGTLVEAYLRGRGITDLHGTGNLRFHPRCYYKPDDHGPTETWPAMIAAVTDLDRQDHRRAPHLARPDGSGKAPSTRRARRWATCSACGPLRCARRGDGGGRRHRDHPVAPAGLPTCRWRPRSRPAISPPSCSRRHLRRLYIVRDNDPAGDGARDILIERANAAGIEAIVLSPACWGLQRGSPAARLDALRAGVRVQLAPEDVAASWLQCIAGRG
jgi:hypothetical protein